MKIFGIGLSRTGTYSLNEALVVLGFRAKHFPHIEQEIMRGEYRLKILEQYDALTDTPVAPIFAQLDRAYPGSKFILTLRPLDAWLDACERYFTWQDKEVGSSSHANVVALQRLYVYGCVTYNRDRWAYVYETHERNVTAYFANRPRDLLKMRIVQGEGWDALCAFLGYLAPSSPFPHANAYEHLAPQVGGFADP